MLISKTRTLTGRQQRLRFIQNITLSTFKHTHRQPPSYTRALSHVQAGSMKFGPPPCPLLKITSMTSGYSPCPPQTPRSTQKRIGEQVLYSKSRGHVAMRNSRNEKVLTLFCPYERDVSRDVKCMNEVLTAFTQKVKKYCRVNFCRAPVSLVFSSGWS